MPTALEFWQALKVASAVQSFKWFSASSHLVYGKNLTDLFDYATVETFIVILNLIEWILNVSEEMEMEQR